MVLRLGIFGLRTTAGHRCSLVVAGDHAARDGPALEGSGYNLVTTEADIARTGIAASRPIAAIRRTPAVPRHPPIADRDRRDTERYRITTTGHRCYPEVSVTFLPPARMKESDCALRRPRLCAGWEPVALCTDYPAGRIHYGPWTMWFSTSVGRCQNWRGRGQASIQSYGVGISGDHSVNGSAAAHAAGTSVTCAAIAPSVSWRRPLELGARRHDFVHR